MLSMFIYALPFTHNMRSCSLFISQRKFRKPNMRSRVQLRPLGSVTTSISHPPNPSLHQRPVTKTESGTGAGSATSHDTNHTLESNMERARGVGGSSTALALLIVLCNTIAIDAACREPSEIGSGVSRGIMTTAHVLEAARV